jgi:hypothetical protein
MTTPRYHENSVREYGGNTEEKLVAVQIHDMPALALTALTPELVDISINDNLPTS